MRTLKRILNGPRVHHYADIFLAAFGVSLWLNKDNLLGAHGLNVWKSLVAAAAVAGAKAVIEAYRKSTPATPPAAARPAVASLTSSPPERPPAE